MKFIILLTVVAAAYATNSGPIVREVQEIVRPAVELVSRPVSILPRRKYFVHCRNFYIP